MNRKKRQKEQLKAAARAMALSNVRGEEKAGPIRKEHEYVETVFGKIIFDDYGAPASSVHQFASIGIFAYRFGDEGVGGGKEVGRYQVAIADFDPEGLAEKLRPILMELDGDEEAAKEVWFKSFKSGVAEALSIFVRKKHGPGTVALMNAEKQEPTLQWYNALLEMTLHDMTVAITSLVRVKQHRLCITVPLGPYVYFTSRPVEPIFSHKDFFDPSTSDGSFQMRGKHYLFKLVGQDGALDDKEEAFDRPFLATSLRQTLNALMYDVTGNKNSIETLKFH